MKFFKRILVIGFVGILLFFVPQTDAQSLLLVYHHEGLTFEPTPQRKNTHIEKVSLVFGKKEVMGEKTFESMELAMDMLPILLHEPTPTPTEIPTPSKTPPKTSLPSSILTPKLSPTSPRTQKLTPTPQPSPKTLTSPKNTTPTPTPTPTTIITSSNITMTNSGGLDPEKLFRMTNEYRAGKGLPAFQKDERVCSVASQRAPHVNAEIAGGYMHAGLKSMNLPYWNTENIISYSSEEGAFNWWIHDTIHREQIEGNYTYSCVACAGYACAQEFTNFIPK